MTTEQANDFLDRISKLDDATSQLLAFHNLLEKLNVRLPLSNLPRAQVNVIGNVRAAILRSAIAQVVAILDRAGSDRASVGQITKLLGDNSFVQFLLNGLRQGRNAKPDEQKLQDMFALYQQTIASNDYARVKQLRDDEIGHILVRDTPTVKYPDIFKLVGIIEQLVDLIFEGLGIFPPPCHALKKQIIDEAELFWATYLAAASNKESAS